MSCKKCITQDQKKTLVSTIYFAKISPKTPAIVAPINLLHNFWKVWNFPKVKS